MHLKIFLICQLVLFKVTVVVPKIQSRIVGGSYTNISQAPFLLQLLIEEKFFCGSTLVTSQFAVTAAHCVKDRQVADITVLAGATNRYQAGVRRKVTKVVIPKNYKNYMEGMDVAVIKLSSPIEGPNIRPIRLCSKSWNKGVAVQVYGWGKLHKDAEYGSKQVKTVSVIVIKKSVCAKRYRCYGNLSNSVFCAYVPGSKDACDGDSGGPAIINEQLCGVVSWGAECGSLYYPGIYTNLLVMRKFITDIIYA